MPSLYRTRDGVGDSGAMSMLIKVKPKGDWYEHDLNEDGEKIIEYGKPKVGYIIRVGSFIARSYSAQDWWQTTPIIEILEETDDYVKFKTASKNQSIYEWKD